jgi:DNA-binding CsgD family transcriptional regulator
VNSSIVILVEPLTTREQEVLDALALGESNAAIGLTLFITEATVRTHLVEIFSKLGVNTRLQAVLTSQELGLVALPHQVAPEVVAILAIERVRPGTLDEARAALSAAKKGAE